MTRKEPRMLTKTRSILQYDGLHKDGCRIFEHPDEEGESVRNIAVALPDEVWADMGSPTTVTVTVAPGDLLNP